MAAFGDLVGPPELKQVKQQEAVKGDAFLDMLHKSMTGQGLPPLGLTENNSVTFLSAGNKCLDFFFRAVPDTPEDVVVSLLEEAWKEDPLMALKLIFQLRGVRGTGKADKKNFYVAALWLYEKHCGTLVANAKLIAAFGYYKDLLEIVLRAVEGSEDTRKRMLEKQDHNEVVKRGKTLARTSALVKKRARRHPDGVRTERGYWGRKGAAAREAKAAGTLKPREERIAESNLKDQLAKEAAATLRKERRLALQNGL